MKPICVTPALVAEATGGKYYGPVEAMNTPITDYVLDNRQAKAGSLFFCMVGERTDGHKYAPAALDAGAVCCVCEKPIDREPYVLVPSVVDALQKLASWYRSQLTIPVIGVTGWKSCSLNYSYMWMLFGTG
jgi:UDP-N-acetylmuramoyl-tripeptide--D-alanyl-D-alanine ligase